MSDPLPADRRPGVFRRLGAAGPFAAILSVWPPIGGFILLAFLTSLGPWLREHAALGMLVYVAVMIVLVGTSFIPTFACAILGGWAFGFGLGWVLAMIALTASSVVAYAIGRWIARDKVLDVIRERPRWNAVYLALLGTDTGKTIFAVALLRIPPTAPFALANFALAAARAPMPAYLIGTILGLAPRTAAATFAAAQLEQLRFKDVNQTWMTVAGIVATVVVCILLGVWANRALQRVTAQRVTRM